jgi:hypothetical protein
LLRLLIIVALYRKLTMATLTLQNGAEAPISDAHYDPAGRLCSFRRLVEDKGDRQYYHYILKHHRSWIEHLRDPAYRPHAAVAIVVGAIAGSWGHKAGSLILGVAGAGAFQTLAWFHEEILGDGAPDGYYVVETGKLSGALKTVYHRQDVSDK